MRILRSSLVAAAWLLAAGAAFAQQAAPPVEPGQNAGISNLPDGGQVDVGFRGTGYGSDSDEARYQRYRDLRNGPFAEGFRWAKTDDTRFWELRATHVGYRDQQYIGNFNKFGKLKASFSFNQIPLFFSDTARTTYTTTSPGVLSLDGIPGQIQSGAATSAIYNTVATPFDLRLTRSITDFRVSYTATEHVDFSAYLKNIKKSGEQPWGGTFGFSDAVEFAAPVDTRTTDIGVAAAWTNDRAQARVGYDGSFFSNNITTLVWDNPLRSTDSSSSGPAQGRESLWPNSDLNSASLSGLLKLGASSQATAYVSLGTLSQNDPLIPFTINSALASPPLDRANADSSAHLTSTAFTFNSRPVPHVWFNARFRTYDFDNQSPLFNVANTVTYDTTVSAFAPGTNSPFSFTRKTLDLDSSWTPLPHASFRAGYTHEAVDQTFRTFDTTNENVLRLSADATGLQNLTVRALYEYDKRTGSGLDEQSLDDLGEQTSLRQFDLSDRSVNRFSTILMFAPSAALSFNGSAFVVRDTRPNTGFGLLDNDGTGISAGVDYVPSGAVSLGASYQYETYSTLQKSRQANPGVQFDDPTRDWTTTAGDHAHTFDASADLLKLWPKTDVRFAYDYVHGSSAYVYGLTADTTLAPVSQLPSIFNTRNRLSADARYTFSNHVGFGLLYWFEKLDIDDFAFNPATLNTVSQPSWMSLQYAWRPYTANTIWARLTMTW
jgi:MtrB/PioB family decaheme-associated outer membrane protein